MRDVDEIYNCLIIGAGQAGLAAGRIALQSGLKFIIVEKGEVAGSEWVQRARDHELFTPRRYSELPGLQMVEGTRNTCPTNVEMARYLENYAKIFKLPVKINSEVISLKRHTSYFLIELSDGTKLFSQSVILANGSNQLPRVPAELSQPVIQCTTQTNARDFWRMPPKQNARILIVGGGASGRQTALEYGAQGYDTTLSGKGRRTVHAYILGQSLFFWLLFAKLLHADRDSLRGRLLARLNPVPNNAKLGNKALLNVGVKLRPALTKTWAASDANGKRCGEALFSDGTKDYFDHVVWCVGYCENSTFNSMGPEKNKNWYSEGKGITEVPGLFVIGRVWLTCRASELVLGATGDARRVVSAVKAYLDNSPLQDITSTSKLKDRDLSNV